jgi:5'(3')-deoxyribonucleotidase
MKKLEILVDLDEVLNNLLECWVSFLNDKHGLDADMQDKKTWGLGPLFPSLTAKEIDYPLFDDNFWSGLVPQPYSVEYLHKMILDGHNVSIVTATHVYKTLPAKMDWLFCNYPYLSWSDVILANRKQLISGDVLIDDAIHNLEGGKYTKLLYDSPYNRDYNAEYNGMIRVHDLKEAYGIISRISNVSFACETMEV